MDVTPTRVWRVSSRLVADLAGAARGRPSRSSTYVAIRRLHEHSGGRTSGVIHGAYRRLPGWADAVDRDELADLERRHATPRQRLLDDGVTTLDPILTPDQVTGLREFAETVPGRCVVDGRTTTATYRDRPEGATGIIVDRDFVWARPEIQALLATRLPADLATACFGARSVQQFPTLVWSLPRDDDDGEIERRMLARRFHCDYDGLHGLRIHIYLTDVDEGSAPMQYVRGSHRPGAVPGSLRRRHGDDLPEPVVLDRFGADAVTTMTGPAGTTFASVSQGLHRATRARTSERLFLVLPIQAGSLAGAYLRQRQVPVADPDFGAALAADRPDLRLYRAGQPVPAGRARIATFA